MSPPSSPPVASATPVVPVRVWDLPTRLFHLLLLSGVVALVVSGQIGGDLIVWHMRLGLAVGALLLFRLVWGLVGGRWSRWSRIVRGPFTVWRYLRGRTGPEDGLEIGHNPLGGWSVLAMMGVLLAQVGSGLVADDEIASTGPLYRYVSGDTALAATAWHTGDGKRLLLGLIALHVLAVVAHQWRGHALIGPMLGGDRWLPAGTPGSADGVAQRLRALVLAAACGFAAWWIGRLG